MSENIKLYGNITFKSPKGTTIKLQVHAKDALFITGEQMAYILEFQSTQRKDIANVQSDSFS